MPTNNLNEIRSLGHLLAYLIDELDWPLADETKLENLTFDYTLEELDLRSPIVVRRLRPLTASQPWGILLLDFAEKSLSITAIRKVLRGFVQRKRQDEQSDRPAWALEHLLFVCQHRGEEGRTLTFVHFEQPALPGRMPRLSSFGWSEQSNNRTVLEHNLPALRWPRDPKDAAAWLKQWQSAFDVEAVTKKFFTAYRDVFAEVEKSIRGVPDEAKRNYTQRLFNRLLFLYFIQRKGWLEFQGQKNYLRALFDATIAQKESFLNDRLYWTFFYGLNTAMEDHAVHSAAELIERRGTVPFLNGGLFDLEDEYDIHEAVTIPNGSFAQILELFERFNFTVSESTPLDIEVAVDPEMLGKVFEELVTGRHESGSYYTPRTIVSFMCREVLKHFLAPAESDAAAVARFVDEGDPANLTAPERVLAALKAVTVCDPACGSGAYLLGMMQELLRLREALFALHQKDHRQIFDRKLEIIQNNLYGADLDLFAVNIAKLRLWLSLAVDFSGVTPPPLPNLDFKIECGDSLTAPDPKTADNIVRIALIDHADELESLKREFVTAHGDKKKELKSEIRPARIRSTGSFPTVGRAMRSIGGSRSSKSSNAVASTSSSATRHTSARKRSSTSNRS